ncbi:hypothetical protein [Ktedonospora formicarum]|uniref:Uncharacterized protein n=1 Tax=Ktedonospora formicarum TaxID=2778364 RepID=A0A8J3MY73_9CHLR|nr:hypothetical protein [Ktedonospora formicarum]GHO49355.1 hypothetical protein KSX_75180 [Ktedonospora formicarum]
MPKEIQTLEPTEIKTTQTPRSRAESYAYLFLAVLCLIDFLSFTFHVSFYWYVEIPHFIITTVALIAACYWLRFRKAWARLGIMVFLCLVNYLIIIAGIATYTAK